MRKPAQRAAPLPVIRAAIPAPAAPPPARRVAPAPAPVRRAAPPPARRVAPAPALLSGRNDIEYTVTGTAETDRVLKRPPLARRKLEVTVYAKEEEMTSDDAKRAMTQMGEMVDELMTEPWVMMDGKRTAVDPNTDTGRMRSIGFWFSLFHKDGDNGELAVSVSELARKYTHSGDFVGVLCERRMERPLD